MSITTPQQDKFTNVLLTPPDSKGTPQELIVPDHAQLMSVISQKHGDLLVSIEKLFSSMRCSLDDSLSIPVITDEKRRRSAFIKPTLYMSVERRRYFSNPATTQRYIVVVIFNNSNNPNGIHIYDHEEFNLQTLKTRITGYNTTNKYEWVHFEKRGSSFVVPWDSKKGKHKLRIDKWTKNNKKCIELDIYDDTDLNAHLNHFYYEHIHPMSNISQGKVMMDVCKSVMYAYGCKYMTLVDASYNIVKTLKTKTMYDESSIYLSRIIETLLRKGSTVYTLYGFLPDDNDNVSFSLADDPYNIIDLNIKWRDANCIAFYSLQNELDQETDEFTLVYEKMLKPVIESISNTPAIWYGENRKEFMLKSVREVLEDGFRKFMSMKRVETMSSPFLSPGEDEGFEMVIDHQVSEILDDLNIDDMLVDFQDFEDVQKQLDF